MRITLPLIILWLSMMPQVCGTTIFNSQQILVDEEGESILSEEVVEQEDYLDTYYDYNNKESLVEDRYENIKCSSCDNLFPNEQRF